MHACSCDDAVLTCRLTEYNLHGKEKLTDAACMLETLLQLWAAQIKGGSLKLSCGAVSVKRLQVGLMPEKLNTHTLCRP